MTSPRREPQLPNFDADSSTTRSLRSEPELPEVGQSPSFVSWWRSLPKEGQLLVGGGAIALGFAVVSLVVKLVSLALSLALFGGFLYIGYKFLSSSSVADRDP